MIDGAPFFVGVKERYENGRGVNTDYIEAVKWYKKAAEQGIVAGQCRLGDAYYYGQMDLTENKSEAVKWYRKAAEQGDARGEYELGYCYEYGRGVEQNNDEAIQWYKKAAAQGHQSAKSNLQSLLNNKNEN